MSNYTELMERVPGSYRDFVIDTVRWMEEDDNIRDAILARLEEKPDADTDDLTLVLWNCLGIDENHPLEIVPDEKLVTV